MIIKNSKDIRKIYFGSTPAPSLNYNNSRAFRYVVDEYIPPVFTCPDVVQTMDGYDGDSKEVYAKDTEKWYMRNNLGNYEEYGILEGVQSLDSATFYEGKLVICDNHEYESIGGNWVDLGAVQGTTKKIMSPSYIYNDSSHLFSIPVGYTASTDTRFTMKIRPTENGGGAILGDNGGTSDQNDYRVFLYSNNFYFDAPGSSSYGNRIYGGSFLNQDSEVEFGNFYIKNLKTGSNVVTGTSFTYQRTSTLILGESNQYGHMATDKFQLSALTMYHGDTLARDFIPAIDGNDICLYDKVSDAYFKSDNGKMPLYGGTITEVEVGTKTYPKDYEVKDAPEDNVTVESLDQIECPYEGMTAYVDGVKYTYENGEWIDYKYIYNIYGTLTGDSATATIKINNKDYTVSPSGADNEFGLVFTEPVTRLSFQQQSSIKTLDKIDIDTSAVTNMRTMFAECNNLTTLDISNFNTSSVTDMGLMFAFNKRLTTLDISNFNTSSVTDMGSMFAASNNLTTVTMNNTNQATFDMIKGQLVSDSVASHVTIIRDGVNWKYQNGAWVEA